MTYMMKKHTTTFQFRPDGIKSLLLMLLLMMTVGATGAWGETDYSGTYFIANGNGYSSTNAANNFYLVPATNANYATDQPHLTTTKSGQVLNCCWQIVKNGDYYRIIHVADGKYLTANPAMAGTSGNDVGRLRVHLQEFADIAADTDGNTLFNIVLNSKGGYNIRHKDMSDKINNSTTTYLDPAGGNVDGTNLTSGRTASTSNGKVNVGGGIGYWTDEAAARWQFEKVPQNNTYTYNIVDRQGNIAIKYTTDADQPAASPLSSYTDIPAAIRSPYLNGETVKFYTFSGAFDADNLTDENKIAATPVADNANIYVTYTTDRLSEKFLRLRGARAFNFVTNDGYAYDNGGTLAYDNVETNKTQTNHLWNISGGDPYAVQIKNLGTHKYLVSSTMPTLSLAETATNNFILMEQSAAADAGSESVMLMKATGNTYTNDPTKAVNAYPVNSNVTYHLIDKADKLIVSVPSTSSELALPDEWVSPLVSAYQYYKDATLSGTAVGSSCDFTGATTVTSPFEVGSGGNIYVKYDVSNAIDITGGKSYLLKFSDGVSFNQENGSDGINTTSTKAVYPYNNGDFNLYVYGQEEWVKQLANGASTRTRWLWKIVSSHNGMLLTGSDIDPYHVVIKSHQNQSLNSGTYAGSTYLRTYKPNNEVGVITGVTYENLTYPDSKPDLTILSPTEYMILGTSMLNMKLTTYNEVEGTRQTVTNFEQYWKNNPTARDILNAADKSVGAQPVTYELPSDQKALLTAKGWHTYECWANAAPWSNTSTGGKTLANGNHWFQTISMGTGLFTVEEVSLAPQVILLDQHGWEVMRVPLTDVATLRKYDSPMVDTYYWYPTALKTTGYHKYHDLDPNIKIYKQNDTKWEWKDEEGYETYTFTSSTLAANPYVDHSEQPASVKTDFYVTYTVKSQYANAYHGAATEDAVTATPYLLKQGGNYATYGGSGTTIGTVATKPSRENLTNNIEWYLKPNFNIDREMGYKYAGETGAQDDAMSKDATEAAYMTNGQNGFDPYNVQIQNRAYPLRYFTANTTGSALSAGLWTGTSGTVALQNMSTKQTAAGYDQTTLNITNATFMVVDDGNGNMRLMPRFDHGMVMQSFGTLATQAAAASAGDEGTGSQTLFLESVTEAQLVYNSDEITDPNGYYLLAESFEFVNEHLPLGTAQSPFTGSFTGIIDGQLHTISGITHPFIVKADGAVIKNVILKDVKISQVGPVGAIAGTASGYTRIYNCGILPTNNKYVADEETSYVQSTGNSSGDVTDSYCGGLVGWLKDDSRVINCFSYANIKGGTDVAGIVGHNETASNTSVSGGKYANLHTAVVNCMFYGNISGGKYRWPVYGGAMMRNDIDNGINNYDFYRAEASLGLADDSHYNCSWPAQEEYLTKYEYYRYLLNSNRELCGWWVGAPSAPSGMTTAQVQTVPKDASLIAKWVLDPIIAPYPILKAPGRYPSVINQAPKPDETNPQRIDSETKQWVSRATASTEWTNPKDAPKTEGQILGNITVTIQDGDEHDAADVKKTFTITAMDIANNDFCYGKIQLPYYNSIFGDPSVEVNATTDEGKLAQWESRYGGNYKDKVVVGWTISSPTGDDIPSITNQSGTDINGVAYDHTFSTDAESGYNFADRYCTTKDEQRVFAQGGYYYVPYGVTAITITAKWATAIYLDNSSNHDYDKVRMSQANDGKQFLPAGTRPTTLANGQTVKTNNINNLIPSGGSVYENAIVLVGNHQYRKGGGDVTNGVNTDGCTIMSADFDLDEEPDYCLIWQLGNETTRQKICPIRFDFLPVVEIGMAMKQNASTQYYSLGCYHPLGHFEVTETSLIHFGQFEFGSSLSVPAPIILNGGIYDQYCKGKNAEGASKDKINYVIVGGNTYLPSFTPGAHVGNAVSTRHCPVNVIGGRINNLYLTGNFSESVTSNPDNPHCYIDGGNFKQVAAAGKEGITGNVFFKIDHSIIKEFYGGSTLGNKYVTGKIDVTIDNSNVTKYCGGPKFSNLVPSDNNSVTTNATGTTFGVYYGGGNGGSSYMQYDYADATVNDATGTFNWGTTGKLNNYTARNYRNTAPIGYHGDYEMEIVNSSAGTHSKQAIFRTYMYSVQFAATDTGPVTNNLTDCKVLTNFYGGGNLGGVKGSVTSTLSGNTRVEGSVFGAGYSASVPEVTIYNKDKTPPTINIYTGIITPTPDPDPASTSTTYTWCYKNKTTNVVIPSGVVIPDGVGTSKPAFEYEGRKYLYTEESLENLGTVTGKVTLNIEGTTTVGKSIYGGGEESGVAGDTEVNVTSGTIGTQGQGGVEYGNVFGGGKGKAGDKMGGLVKGNTTVTISGTPTIHHNVYGGGAYGSVGDFTYDATSGMPTALHTENTGKCTVSITGGTIGTTGDNNGMVFGSSRGDVATPEGEPAVDPNDRMAWVYSTNVTIGTPSEPTSLTTPKIAGSVYGSGENGHTFKDTEVIIHSGTIGIAEGETITDNNGTDDTSDDKTYSGAAYPYRGNVYGGGCGTDMYWIDANGNGEKDDGEKHYNPIAGIVRGNATVTIDGGHVVRNVYGAGAMGSVGNEAEAESASTSGKTIVTIKGKAKIGVDGNDNGNVYGAARGDLNVQAENYANYANVRETELEINDNADIKGSAFGGGEAGIVWESVAVNMKGGSVANDVYGGGALANTQIAYTIPANAEKIFTTNVNLTGGTIGHNVYGGGLGRMADETKGVTAVEAKVYGKVVVALNGTKTVETVGEKEVTSYNDNCVVKGSIFGCNNQNGSPQDAVTVHIYKTTGWEGHAGTASDKKTSTTAADHSYHLAAVYGGGNLAAFIPDKASVLDTLKTHVIIDGCDMTSIRQVYGGGNAASVPATDVLVNGTYEIEEVFGGGNGKDDVSYDGGTTYIKNPGANVGYKNYSTYDAVNNEWNDKEDADTKSERLSSGYIIGTGAANVNINGGTIHRVFGGSNTKGNVRITAVTMLEEAGGCPFCVDEAYGGGKSAPMDAEAKLLMACIPGLKEAYGGAQNAEIDGDVTLNITNGTFERIFGGNDEKGYIKGTITVNIEETGCKPIIIGELYGGGNQAPYTAPEGKHGPTLNVRSFTSIGDIYGGGLGSTATVTGDTYVNINVSEGRWHEGDYEYATDPSVKVNDKITELNEKGYHAPEFTSGMGSIHTVFGGGNAAPVTGNTNVNIGTSEYEEIVSVATGADVTGYYTRSGEGTEASPYTYTEATGTAVEGTTYYQKVKGANIVGNVYGGGNNAEVTGDTHVVIGEKYEAPSTPTPDPSPTPEP